MKRRFKRYANIVVAISMLAAMLITAAGCSKKESKTDWEYIKDKGELVIGLDDTFAPMGFRDKDNKIVGFDIDLAKAVGKELGVKVKFQPVDWDAKEAQLKARKIDCIWNGLSDTEERRKAMGISQDYLNNRILVMSLDPNISISDSKQFADVKLGTQAGSSAEEYIKADPNYDSFKDNVKAYKTYDEAILDMKAGRIQAVAIDEVYAIYNNANKDRLYESPFNFGSDYYCIAFRKGDKETVKKVNEALQKVTDDGKAAEISMKWFGKDMMAIVASN